MLVLLHLVYLIEKPSCKKMLKNNLKLNALAWKAKSVGESYGVFCLHLSEQEKELIFAEYEQILEKKEKEEVARLEKVKIVNAQKRKK